MESLIKVLSAFPKWFSSIGLFFVLVMLGVTTYSVSRTILLDCGSIQVAGTSIGGHCDNSKRFVSTSVWEAVALPRAQELVGQGGNINRCDRAVFDSMGTLKKLGEGPKIHNSGTDILFKLHWYKFPYRDGLYDVLFQCNPSQIEVIVNSNASWPASNFLEKAVSRLREAVTLLQLPQGEELQ